MSLIDKLRENIWINKTVVFAPSQSHVDGNKAWDVRIADPNLTGAPKMSVIMEPPQKEQEARS